MIRMIFTVNREMVNFIIIDKYIYYSDRKTKSYVRCLPKPEKLIDIQKKLERMFTLTDEELKEYESCKTEDDIAKAVIKDAALKSCRLVIRKDFPTTEEMKNLIKDKEVLILNDIT
jgi:hypothetical protein